MRSPRAGQGGRRFAAAGLAALAGGGYWYLRNLVHTGNPLPWVHHLGPISLPAPEQALGGREAHSVLGYLTDGSVWSDWFLPGLHHGLGFFWPLLGALALAGLLLCLGRRRRARCSRVVGACRPRGRLLAWLVAPTSASGPDGMPRGFESGLRYLVPALVLGLALLPATPPLRNRFQSWVEGQHAKALHTSGAGHGMAMSCHGGGTLVAAAVLVLLVGIAAATRSSATTSKTATRTPRSPPRA